MTDPILTFIHISDTHIAHDPDQHTPFGKPYDNAQALVAHINALPIQPDFILHTGDIAYNRDPDDYETCKDLFSQLDCPIYYVAGNGDEVTALQQTMLDSENPITPFHYDVEINGVQLIVLDSNGHDQPPAGLVNEAQLSWLRDLCNADDTRPLIIALHHNPQIGGIPWLDDVTGIQNTAAFHSAILPAKARLRGVFFGHIHQNVDLYREGILYCSTLSSWAQFHAWQGQTETLPAPDDGPGFSVVMVYDNQTFIRRHRFVPPQHS